MKTYNGYQQYDHLDGVEFMAVDKIDVEHSDVVNKDSLLDLIFKIDPVTNLPSGVLSQYLSDKTNAQVRDYIERNILIDLPDTGVSIPESLRTDYLKLGSDFIAEVAREPYESREAYEARIEKKFNEIEADKQRQKENAKWRKRFKDIVNASS